MTLIGSAGRKSCREMREMEKAYCISPKDMKGSVTTGLVLSLINLVLQKDEKQRMKIADKNI